MKKIYFAPETQVYKIETVGMLAQSTFGLNDSPSDPEIQNPGNALGREFDLEEGNEFDNFEDFEE